MREIEFRGKDIETGEWVFGDLHTLCDKPHIHTDKSKFPYAGKRSFVIPETIGQFTGLLDKNGKKIFEGDVIKCGMRLYVCEFIEGGFEFRDLSDSQLILKAIVNISCIIGNIHDNPELINKEHLKLS